MVVGSIRQNVDIEMFGIREDTCGVYGQIDHFPVISKGKNSGI